MQIPKNATNVIIGIELKKEDGTHGNWFESSLKAKELDKLVDAREPDIDAQLDKAVIAITDEMVFEGYQAMRSYQFTDAGGNKVSGVFYL